MYVIFLLELGFEKEAEDEEEEEKEEGEEVGMARREKCGGEERICGDGKRVPKLSVLDYLLRFRWWHVYCRLEVIKDYKCVWIGLISSLWGRWVLYERTL